MASGKQSPRQKMINMMYLVLTALLALNISKDILHALTKLNNSLSETVATVENKNADTYANFAAAAAENPGKAGEWNTKALDVKAKSEELVKYLESLKLEIINLSGGFSEDEPTVPKSLDAREGPANYLLNEGNATILKEKIDAYKASVLQYTKDPKTIAIIEDKFDTGKQKVGKDQVETSWESANFEHYPLAAILPFITNIEADVRVTESDVIKELEKNIDAGAVKFTGVDAIVDVSSNYVTQGDEFEAEVFLAAYDEDAEPEFNVTIDGTEYPVTDIKNGRGKIKFKTTKVGEIAWGGSIKVSQLGAEDIFKEFNKTFTVAPPSVVISPTKMNVLYKGVDNPLEIGVPGVDPSKIIVNGPGVRKTGSGTYVADVKNVSQKEISISVSVQETDEEGKTSTRAVGKKEFRVKGLPPAVGSIFGKTEGQMSKSLMGKGVVEARYQDFPFDLALTVTSFEIAIPGFPPEAVKGNKMNASVKQRIEKLRPGQTISIRKIKASGPKGLKVPNISNISIDIN